MSGPKPGTVVLRRTTVEGRHEEQHWDHVDVHEGYVYCHDTVSDGTGISETRYYPLHRVHVVKRDHTTDSRDADAERKEVPADA